MLNQLSLALALASIATAAPAPAPKVFNRGQPLYFPRSASCTTYYTPVTGDTCNSIAAAKGITLSAFEQMNPSVNSRCTNLFAGSQYCVSNGSDGSSGNSTLPITASGAMPSGTGISSASTVTMSVTSTATATPMSTSSTSTGTASTPTGSSGSGSGTDSSSAKVTNTAAFTSGAGNKKNSNENDGVGKGTDSYTCYSGTADAYPDSSKWVSFEDMWTANEPYIIQGCKSLGLSVADTTAAQAALMKSGIQSVAEKSLVDHRFILATIMQESIGCVNTISTNNGVQNNGIMQSHDGVSFDASKAAQSIEQMIIDGVQGTSSGDGLVQVINKAGNVYAAARMYNSGSYTGGNLNDANGATASYVVDMANRLTGWVTATKKTCS